MSSATVFMQINSKFALYSSNSDVSLIDVNNKCMMCTQGSRDTSLYVCFKARQIYEQAEITKENDHIFNFNCIQANTKVEAMSKKLETLSSEHRAKLK